MAIREIITPAHPVLRKKAHKITNFNDPKLQLLIDDMVDTLMDAPGVGLAAPQVAAPLRLIVVRLPDDEESQKEYGNEAGKLYIILNPEIIRASTETVEGVEACLSIPGYIGNVERNVGVTVRGQDRNGKPIRIKATDWQARVFQHEIDHLDGVLYIDRATEIWKVKPQDDAEPQPDPLAGMFEDIEEVDEEEVPSAD
ncbi:MAG TPA: peptide deformylase [Aggregatilineaceae bacterium]|nr:peptide deformylase [Aggregatilineaceae bacterium]